MSNVKVTMSGSQYTNSSDEAFFLSQPAREKYSWSAEKTGYYALQDSFHLETDTTLQITMEPGTMVQKNQTTTSFLFIPTLHTITWLLTKKFPCQARLKWD